MTPPRETFCPVVMRLREGRWRVLAVDRQADDFLNRAAERMPDA